MCGIFGAIALNPFVPINEDRARMATAAVHHRGPDSQLVCRISSSAVLGHARLSIIDLSNLSQQPMLLDSRYCLVYNGELFNYLELRKELEDLGETFLTPGDTEVVLRSYRQWGESCVRKFNGMWAFAIFDKLTNSLFASRDRFGEKPFNYVVHGECLIFASEIKSIIKYEPSLAQPNYRAVENFCRTSVGAQHEQTWFKDIKRLQPGHNLKVNSGKLSINRYWRYPTQIIESIKDSEAIEEYGMLFEDAVKIRMRSDVPIGISLSEGVDSNSIAFTMARMGGGSHHCFTSRFKEDNLSPDAAIFNNSAYSIDESLTAKRVARNLNFKSHIVETDYSNLVADLGTIITHLESGNSAPAVIPLMQLMHEAKKHVKVILDGQGADEMLAGYVVNTIWYSVFDSLAAGKIDEAIASILEYSRTYKLGYSVKMALRTMSNHINAISKMYEVGSGINAIFGPLLSVHDRISDYPDLTDERQVGFLSMALQHQHSGGLVNLLHYGDAISMANSVEARMPFLDHRLVEFTWKLPARLKLNRGVGKYIHRQAMCGVVDAEIIENKVKFGYSSPISQQFRKESLTSQNPIEVVLSERCLQRGLFEEKGLRKIVDLHCKGVRDYGTLLFRVLSTELWFQKFMDQR